jgi:hypothetical protein
MAVSLKMRIGMGVLLQQESFDKPDLLQDVANGTSGKFYSLPGSILLLKKFWLAPFQHIPHGTFVL